MLLDDVTVVELAVHRAAPFCTALLADLGADVVKIERPGVGDPTRTQGAGPEGKSGYFSALNRNKRSVELDLKTDAGQTAARELVADADVFVENFGYGVAERLGLGYDRLAESNPELVYASIKGYGTTGPMKEKPGLDLILQAEGGIMSLTGPEDGDPVKVGQAVGDLTSGMFAAVGVLARLHDAERTGAGGQFDVSLFDAVVTLLNEYPTQYDLTGEVPGTQGTSHQTLVPYQLFDTADGQIVLGVPSDDRWDEFVDAVGCESVREFGSNDERVANRADVVEAIQDRLNEEPADHWAAVLDDAGFPNGPLNDVAEVVAHPQAEARDLFARIEDDGTSLLLPNHPLHFPDLDGVGVRGPAPDLGEHTESVFADVAGDQTTLDQWRSGGAFGGDGA
jgi:crotonobetainyl-CoA:carnitine CoA-transferase CaiB-like acyl-CoA transferase